MNDNKTTAKGRTIWVDAARGVAIILVLLGHNNPPFIKYIFGFHMPFFFVLSGFLFSDTGTAIEYIQKILKKYVLVYWILGLINTFVYLAQYFCVTRGFSGALEIIKRNLLGILLVDSENMLGCGPIWFLIALAIALIVFKLIMLTKNIALIALETISVSLIGIALGMYSNTVGFRIYFKFDIALVSVLFVAIGYFIKTIVKKESLCKYIPCEKKSLQIVSVICLLVTGYLAIRCNLAGSWVDMNNSRYGNIALFYLGAITWSVALIIIMRAFTSVLPTKFTAGITFLGTNTLFLMGFDEASNNTAGILLNIMGGMHVWYIDFIIRSIFLCAFFVVYLLLKKLKCQRR